MLALAALVAALVAGVGMLLTILCGVALMGTVIAAVHHAEVVAHRVGEPFGTLVLALAVTVIETALILSMVIAGGNDMAVLARDSIYAAVMIICTGVVGICVLLGGIAHREQTFRVEGAGAGLAALIVMSALTLVLPVFTTTTPGGTYSGSQLAFVAVTSAALWAIFIFVQTVRHRDYFIPGGRCGQPGGACRAADDAGGVGELRDAPCLARGSRGPGQDAFAHHRARGRGGQCAEGRGRNRDRCAGLAAGNVGRGASCPGESTAEQHESCDRLRARLHRSHCSRGGAGVGRLRLALRIGLEPKDIAMLMLTFLVSAVTLGTGRTYLMQGAVHLVLFAAYLFLAFVP